MIALASRSPGEIAQSLTGRNYLSWSAISTYLKCPLRYRFRYLEGLPEEFLAANLVFGQAVHAALDAFYQHQLSTGHALGLEPLLAAYHDHWRTIDLGSVQFNKDDDLAGLGRLAERMLGAFVASDLARPEGRILGIEEELQAPVIDGVPDLLARLDLLVDASEELILRDFKTSRSRWSEADVAASAGQLLLYHELVAPIFASALARFGIAQALAGRRVGVPLNVREVLNRSCRGRHGYEVQSLHCWNGADQAWQELVVEDRRATPAEVAAWRIDIAAWLASLPRRTRAIAKLLVTGESTSAVAHRFKVTSGRISQVRRELELAWRRFQGDAELAAA